MRSRNFPIRSAISALAVLALAIVSVPASAQAAVEESASSEHFTITWPVSPDDPSVPDLTDTDEDGVPDSVARVLRIFEAARAFQVETLGLQPPPNGDDYPLYVNPGAAALPFPGDARSRASYILVRPDLLQGSSRREIRRFAAHEYAHAIQYGYDYLEDDWFMEASSTWMEGAFSDLGNPNYGQLVNFLPQPRLPLTTVSEAHEYGAFVYVQFLIERYAAGDATAIRELWENVAIDGVSSLGGIEAFLSTRGVSVHEMWREFMLWNWRLGRYEEGVAYRRYLAGVWPQASRTLTVEDESCRISTDGGSPFNLSALSGDYAKLTFPGSGATPGVLRMLAPPSATALALITTAEGVEEVTFTFDEAGLSTYQGFFGRSGIHKIVLMLGNGSASAGPITVLYSLQLEGADGTAATKPSAPSSTTYGSGVGVSGQILCNGQGAPGAKLTLVHFDHSTGLRTDTPITANPAGGWSASTTPEGRSTFWVEVDDPWISKATSPTSVVSVAVFVEMDVQSQFVDLGKPARLDGAVFPAHQNAKVLVEYRRPAGTWRVGPSTFTNDSGSFSIDLVLPRKGVWEIQARVTDTRDDDHEPGLSVARTVVVEP